MRFTPLLIPIVLAACGGAETPATSAPTTAPATPPATATEPCPALPIVTDGETPCFPGPPLVAWSIYTDLEAYSGAVHVHDGRSPLPSGEYGTCTVSDAAIVDARGQTVAQLGCGILVEQPGIVDHIGLQVGASGQQVIDRHPGALERVQCVAAGEQSRCWFNALQDYEEPAAKYTLNGPLHAQAVDGAEALAHVAAHNVVQFHMTIYCH